VWFWIDRFASEDLLKGRSNDEHWEIEFRGSDLWNLRQAVESLEEQYEHVVETRRLANLALGQEHDRVVKLKEQLETAQKALREIALDFPSRPQDLSWRVICHGCKQSAEGFTDDREAALSAIEAWKSEHRLRPGCRMGPTSHSVSGVPNQDNAPTSRREDT